MKGFIKSKSIIFTFLVCLGVFSCIGGDGPDNHVPNTSLKSFSEVGYNFSLHLTDAPNEELKEVFVNIKSISINIGKGKNFKDTPIAQDLGQVDLLTLQNGVLMGIAEFDLPVGTKVNQVRIELYEDGNYITYEDGSSCDLQTPSAQQSGLKLISPVVEVKDGEQLSLVVDFDAKKSIVHQGNGGCLLKPVLRWGGITSRNVETEEEDVIVENGEDSYEDDGEDSGSDSDDSSTDDSGSDSNDSSTDDSGSDSNDSSSEDSGSDSNDSSSEDSNSNPYNIVDCQTTEFDLYDSATWPNDFNWEEYSSCY